MTATVGPVRSASCRIEMRHAPTGPCDAPTNVPRVDEIGGTSVPTTRRSTVRARDSRAGDPRSSDRDESSEPDHAAER